jgi:hypothetical protein
MEQPPYKSGICVAASTTSKARPSCHSLLFACVMTALLVNGQASLLQRPATTQMDIPQIIPVQDSTGLILRTTTREVIARGRDSHPANNLEENDFKIFEGGHKDKANLREITGFRVIDPDSQEGRLKVSEGGVVLPLGGRC